VPDVGGWRYLGRQQGEKNRAATVGEPRSPLIRTAFVHTVIDDHSRVAYAEIHDDETAITATGGLRRAVAWYAESGVTTRRVLSDNGSAYKSRLWPTTCADLGISVKKTRPYRPQTNGKIERFHRTLADGWAFAKLYTSEKARRAALPAFLHDYNHHRPHTAIGKHPNGSVPRSVFPALRLVGLGGRPAVTEGDGEGVQHGLPAHRPSGPASPCRVQAAGHKVQALQRGLLAREMAPGSHGPPIAGVQRLDRVRGTDHLPDLDVIVEERDELVPGVTPQPDHRPVLRTPFLFQVR
jgi:hypothetical protein